MRSKPPTGRRKIAPKRTYDVAIAKADGDRKVAVEACEALQGDAQENCKKQAEDAYETAKAQAQATRDASACQRRWHHDGDHAPKAPTRRAAPADLPQRVQSVRAAKPGRLFLAGQILRGSCSVCVTPHARFFARSSGRPAKESQILQTGDYRDCPSRLRRLLGTAPL
jgi:hypothetical protein